jgi:zinc/manganese transport system substrate-binding protein
MISRRLLLASATALAMVSPAFAQDRMPVVATFSILGDVVSEIGGDRVAVTTLVGPDGDAHVYQPSPADAQAVAAAKVVFVNGLGFEGWIDRLIAAAEYTGPVVVASEGVTPIAFGEEEHDHDHAGEEAGHDHDHEGHDHGAEDPHAWQSVTNVALYVGNIERGLAAADPEGADTYKANAAAYLAELDALDAEIRAAIAALPEDRRTIVTSHDAFGYFGAAYGMTFKAPQGISTESEASAADVAALITQIRDEKIPAVFMENISDPRLLEQIAAETDAKIGGTLYSDALSGPEGPASTYLTMMRYNLGQLTAALAQ